MIAGPGALETVSPLLEAFRGVGPLVGEAERDRVREAACARLDEALRRLARRVTRDVSEQQDAAQVVLMRLVRVGPRGQRAGDPDSDARLAGFLVQALKNAVSDQRPRHRTVDWETVGDRLAATDPLPDAAVAEAEHASIGRHAAQQTSALVAQLAAAAAAGMPSEAAATFNGDLAQLMALVDGRAALDAVVQAEAEATQASVATVKNRLYKRYQRVREHLLHAIDAQVASGALDEAQHVAVRFSVDRLRLRPKG
jgi:DNA-directed RNA polymerase specialized sigma24 family protein